MHRISYLLARILKLDYHQMIKVARQVATKSQKRFLFIFFDMIYCGFKFQAGYYDYQEFEFYLLNDQERATYLTRGKNNEIIRRYNNKEKFPLFENKATFYRLFAPFIQREWRISKELSFTEFKEFIIRQQQLIVKPLCGSGGKGIYRITADDDLKAVYRKLQEEAVLLEEFIKQDAKMSTLYAASVNSLRMFTFYKDGQSYFLQAALKIGNGGLVDNFSSGGMYAFVDEEGIVYTPALDQADHVYAYHPVSGTPIKGFQVPKFKEAVALVLAAAHVVKDVRYIGWDVAIGEKGPLIIEGNVFPGVFQAKPSTVTKRVGAIAKYRTVMDIFNEKLS